MQTIRTKFFGPTNRKDSRYKAIAGNGEKGFTLTVNSDHRLNNEQNHYRVAAMLIEKLGWFHDAKRGDTYGEWFGGGIDGEYIFVCTVEYAKVQKAVL